MTHWLGVVSRDHVRRAVELGIAQIGHGKRGGLERMAPGDTLIYYSPRTSLRDGEPLKAFTALGVVAGDEVWQADEGDFKPWRRTLEYETAVRDLPIDELKDRLDLTAKPNWGYALRRGLLELSPRDHELVATAMRA